MELQRHSEFAGALIVRKFFSSYLLLFPDGRFPKPADSCFFESLRLDSSSGVALFCFAWSSRNITSYMLNDAWRKHGGCLDIWFFCCGLWCFSCIRTKIDLGCVSFLRSNHILIPKKNVFAFLFRASVVCIVCNSSRPRIMSFSLYSLEVVIMSSVHHGHRQVRWGSIIKSRWHEVDQARSPCVRAIARLFTPSRFVTKGWKTHSVGHRMYICYTKRQSIDFETSRPLE